MSVPNHLTQLAVVTVNYRSASDTIECIESLLEADCWPWIIVVDNASGDGSSQRIIDWARNNRKVCDSFAVRDARSSPAPLDALLTLVCNDSNGGFSNGNNVGLRLALQTEHVETFWLLNNDTKVDRCAAEHIARYFAENTHIGMAGTQVRLYHNSDHWQLLNGMEFDRWTGAARGIMSGEKTDTHYCAQEVIAKSDFICGASMVLSKTFLDEVGLLEERFFLYYEEVDLAFRGRAFPKGFVEKAVVYHKEGATAGSASNLTHRPRSALSEYHHIRSKMIFARKHLPFMVPIYALQNLIIWARRLARRQPAQAKAIVRAILGLPLQR